MACFTMGSPSSFVLTLLYFSGLSSSTAARPFASNVPIRPEDLPYADKTQDANITGSLLEDVQTKDSMYGIRPTPKEHLLSHVNQQ
jgi:hypothetical protein